VLKKILLLCAFALCTTATQSREIEPLRVDSASTQWLFKYVRENGRLETNYGQSRYEMALSVPYADCFGDAKIEATEIQNFSMLVFDGYCHLPFAYKQDSFVQVGRIRVVMAAKTGALYATERPYILHNGSSYMTSPQDFRDIVDRALSSLVEKQKHYLEHRQ
jgi:hypothetical protein